MGVPRKDERLTVQSAFALWFRNRWPDSAPGAWKTGNLTNELIAVSEIILAASRYWPECDV